jgi:hypothetical protein
MILTFWQIINLALKNNYKQNKEDQSPNLKNKDYHQGHYKKHYHQVVCRKNLTFKAIVNFIQIFKNKKEQD